MHPDPRRRSRHSRGEKYVLAGGAGQNMILSFSAGCGRRNSARRALPGESVGRKGGLGPSGLFTGCRPDLLGVPSRASPLDGRGLDTLQGISHPQSLPLGGRTVRGTVRSGPGEATINHRWAGEAGSDEGAIWYPTFPCRKKALSQLSPQRGFSIAPLGNPIAPSSVTFGDSFPPRGSLWVVEPYPKKRPKSGHAHGLRNSPTTALLRSTTPKRASGNERPLTQGGGGPPPATLCVRAFS